MGTKTVEIVKLSSLKIKTCKNILTVLNVKVKY